jgi:hypothetical protein
VEFATAPGVKMQSIPGDRNSDRTSFAGARELLSEAIGLCASMELFQQVARKAKRTARGTK